MQRGVAHLFIILLASTLIIVIVVLLGSYNDRRSVTPNLPIAPEASIIASPSSSPSSSPTSQPTIVATATPVPVKVVTPTPKPSAAPTSKPVSGPPGSGYSAITISTDRGNFPIKVISIDMGGVRMVTDTANDNDCGNDCATKSLADFVSANGGFAGINGTYFCPSTYPECSSKKNTFDFPVWNSRLSHWVNGGNLFWNDRSIMYQDGGGVHFMRDAKSFGGGLSAGIVNAPGLVEGGNVIADQFPLSDKQRAKGTKSGIGLRGNVVYLVVANNVDMLDLAHIFKSLGASGALNLDGGGSSALWFGGYKAGPGRALPNAIVFAR